RLVSYKDVRALYQEAGLDAANLLGGLDVQNNALFGALRNPPVELLGAFERLGGASKTWKTLIADATQGAMKEADDIIRMGLLSGAKPNQIAKGLRQYVRGGEEIFEAFRDSGMTRDQILAAASGDPRFRGALRTLDYNARRIAWSETFNARREAEVTAFAADPLIKAVRWTLAPDRGTLEGPDECDVLAHADFFGLGPGVFPIDQVPPPPHPFDRCELVPVVRGRNQAGRKKPSPRRKRNADQVRIPRSKGLTKRRANRIRERVQGSLDFAQTAGYRNGARELMGLAELGKKPTPKGLPKKVKPKTKIVSRPTPQVDYDDKQSLINAFDVYNLRAQGFSRAQIAKTRGIPSWQIRELEDLAAAAIQEGGWQMDLPATGPSKGFRSVWNRLFKETPGMKKMSAWDHSFNAHEAWLLRKDGKTVNEIVERLNDYLKKGQAKYTPKNVRILLEFADDAIRQGNVAPRITLQVGVDKDVLAARIGRTLDGIPQRASRRFAKELTPAQFNVTTSEEFVALMRGDITLEQLIPSLEKRVASVAVAEAGATTSDQIIWDMAVDPKDMDKLMPWVSTFEDGTTRHLTWREWIQEMGVRAYTGTDEAYIQWFANNPRARIAAIVKGENGAMTAATRTLKVKSTDVEIAFRDALENLKSWARKHAGPTHRHEMGHLIDFYLNDLSGMTGTFHWSSNPASTFRKAYDALVVKFETDRGFFRRVHKVWTEFQSQIGAHKAGMVDDMVASISVMAKHGTRNISPAMTRKVIRLTQGDLDDLAAVFKKYDVDPPPNWFSSPGEYTMAEWQQVLGDENLVDIMDVRSKLKRYVFSKAAHPAGQPPSRLLGEIYDDIVENLNFDREVWTLLSDEELLAKGINPDEMLGHRIGTGHTGQETGNGARAYYDRDGDHAGAYETFANLVEAETADPLDQMFVTTAWGKTETINLRTAYERLFPDLVDSTRKAFFEGAF
ncbi:MAG: hypothetical protein ACYTFQ_21575, partial [Planctomycetota bacterium]